MKFLIDTNILIALEPTSDIAIEPGAQEAAEVARLIQQSENRVVVNPHVLADIARDQDLQRRTHREHVHEKYPVLDGAPQLTVTDEAVQNAIGDTWSGGLRWDPKRCTLELHLARAIQSRSDKHRKHEIENPHDSIGDDTGASPAPDHARPRASDRDLVDCQITTETDRRLQTQYTAATRPRAMTPLGV